MIPATTGTAFDMLSDYRAARGILMNDLGLTIGGVILDLHVVQTSARAAVTDSVSFGMIVTNEETITEAPLPLDPQGQQADWFWTQTIGAPGAASGDSLGSFEALGGPIRAKAMRRMDEVGMNLFFVGQADGATTYNVIVAARVLIILP